MDRYVVIGNPVSHSKSPLIHSHFAEQTGQSLEYTALLAEKAGFRDAVMAFFDNGGRGANITVPFKEEAFALADQLSPEATLAGAANTLAVNDDGQLFAHNTDGIGLVTDIRQNHDGALAGKSILLLGAGGAARGILQPIIKEQPSRLCIANRTTSKAEMLAELFAEAAGNCDPALEIKGCGFDELPEGPFDWIINATSASLEGNIPDIPVSAITETTWCYDLMYSNHETPFCRWAREGGAEKVMDGLGMLVEQAAESFQLWRGVRPQTGEIIRLLRQP